MKYVITLLCLFFASCSKEPEIVEPINHEWDTSFFAPRIGEKLVYLETSKSISPTQTSPIALHNIEKKVIKRVQIYDGTETIDGQIFHRNSIHLDGKFKEGFLFRWSGNFLMLAGSFLEGEKPTINRNFIPIASIDMKIGSYWHWPKEAEIGSGFRVVAFEAVKVPAGTFDSYKVTIRKNQSKEINLREYWFAPKIGIVKENSYFYSGGFLRNQTTIELTDRIIPENPTNEPSL